jgi:hypothetical protein
MSSGETEEEEWFHGFCVGPKALFEVEDPMPNSSILVYEE